MGSMIQVSRNFQMPFRTFFEPPNQPGTCSDNSCLEASSICCSPVFPSSSSFSLKDTKAAGERAARQREPPLTGGGGCRKKWRVFWKNRGRLYVRAVKVKVRVAWDLIEGKALGCRCHDCLAQARAKSKGALIFVCVEATVGPEYPCPILYSRVKGRLVEIIMNRQMVEVAMVSQPVSTSCLSHAINRVKRPPKPILPCPSQLDYSHNTNITIRTF